jgi:hypothetical protein
MKKFNTIILSIVFLVSCSEALEPMSSNYYTDDNLDDYPSLIKGFVDKAYALSSVTYMTNEYIYMDCAADNGVITSNTAWMRKLANGSISPSEDPTKAYWDRDYTGIYYVNRFLENNKGYNTQYMRDADQDQLIRKAYQGDAYGLRAWFLYDLLCKFGGRGTDGQLYGVPIFTTATAQTTADPSVVTRASFDECIQQIIDDCDSAFAYLPLANRDYLASNTAIEGSCRWSRLDGMSVVALKSLAYLLWASPTFNPASDITRWQKAAEYSAQAMRLKQQIDGPKGFSPTAPFFWTDPNSSEAFWISRPSALTSTMEKAQYPFGFTGNCLFAPSQELVDAFPAANGYPITDSRSGYNHKMPYANRDPRFYATIFYNGSSANREGSGAAMYTFETFQSGKDESGQAGNGLTNYYLKKFLYMGWNPTDATVQTMPRAVIYIGWRDVCLAYAEAANIAYGPEVEAFGYTAKQAIGFVRSRKTTDGEKGLGATSDPYLNECCTNQDKFNELVRNERRIEFCFEGKRFLDLVRWGVPLNERNTPLHKVKIIKLDTVNAYSTVEVDQRNMPSIFLPVPYTEIVNAPAIVQNEGWESWTR